MIVQPTQEQIDLENIKNQITLSEGELLRLKKLRDSEEYTVSELVKEKKWHEDEIVRYTADKENVVREIEKIKDDLEQAQKIVDTAENMKSQLEVYEKDLEEQKHKNLRMLNNKHAELASREDSLMSKEHEYIDRTNTLSILEAKMSAREERLVILIQELQKDI